MTAMTPGSNLPLSAVRVAVDVTAPVRLDVSGLLLAADGKVRSDDDFVFYNQPAGPGVTHSAAAGGGDTITVDTAAVPDGIEKIVVTASLDQPGATFAGTEPTGTVRNADDGSVLASFTPPQLGTETALVVVEIYRRGGAWKVRAVGQGYANGLAGIATDFGVSVEEPAAPAAAPQAPPAPPAPAAPAAPAGQWGPPAGTPAPVAPPAAPPAPAAAPAAPAAPGKINLDKGRVSLQKNQTVSLVKGGSPLLSSVRMGLGWEPAFRSKSIDLDASVIAYGPDRKKVDNCFFGKLMILGGAIQHSGDNLTGEGAGDDEAITVHLGGLPPEVTGLVFVVNSFSGQKFSDVAKAYCRLLDAQSGEELVRFDLTHSEPRTGVMMAKLIRQFSGEWEMTALGEYVDARTVRGMVKPAGKAL
ncbi:TerD family protein [Streptomyces sp. Je 1-4]|uniref:TerD family protein n=1 Tax=Streptomyces TaxID=1883 RepID=UPI00140EF040|nr:MULTISPECIES: TerD family protein [unclassified Streptomyces]QIK09387.1 TerD family protein [Streptomyces sp. ID38640]UYB43088.1 TerD family protein [Streptomyces sp. Je 1-4]UZQ39441.1 TerD family protein [Streptomyces sp. Je 1-4] [Streptomyces sp. Je 1-4 4N24]UZQ46858.1 TerD family protein [Streptomyces sp. Je 1-4] [Streptomyces sp. Je 1-4 4N24_ara]